MEQSKPVTPTVEVVDMDNGTLGVSIEPAVGKGIEFNIPREWADLLAEALGDSETWRKFCQAEVFSGNRIDPPEWCDELAEPGKDYCTTHKHAADQYREDWELQQAENRADLELDGLGYGV